MSYSGIIVQKRTGISKKIKLCLEKTYVVYSSLEKINLGFELLLLYILCLTFRSVFLKPRFN